MMGDSADSGRAPRQRARERRRENRQANRQKGARLPTVWIVAGGERRRRLEVAALGQDLDTAFGLFEARVAKAGQMDAAFVQRKRLLEWEVAFFELFDERIELGDRGLEVFD